MGTLHNWSRLAYLLDTILFPSTVPGPRQVGKTTSCAQRVADAAYLNWDDADVRRVILAGPAAVADRAGLTRLAKTKPTLVFDELHKHGRWKAFSSCEHVDAAH